MINILKSFLFVAAIFVFPIMADKVRAQSSSLDMPFGMAAPAPSVDEDEPGPRIYDEEIPTKNDSIIYVMDISGSMDWDARAYTGLDGTTRVGTRLDRAKTELVKSIQSLSRQFEFNVFSYDCGIYRWSAAKQRAEPGPKAAAAAWVFSQMAMGGTGTGPAVATALRR